jgi:metallophosphoesterase superfamily enzyme
MRAALTSHIVVAENVLLDCHLALFHRCQRWLAVADLHFGYELSQRAAGNLFPLWGMQTIEARLLELLGDYNPALLLLLGHLVHDAAGAAAFHWSRDYDNIARSCSSLAITTEKSNIKHQKFRC